MIKLDEKSRIGKVIEAESRLKVTRGWKVGRKGSYCLMIRVCIGSDENLLAIVIMVAQHSECMVLNCIVKNV